jgi:hypothetical protein
MLTTAELLHIAKSPLVKYEDLKVLTDDAFSPAAILEQVEMSEMELARFKTENRGRWCLDGEPCYLP